MLVELNLASRCISLALIFVNVRGSLPLLQKIDRFFFREAPGARGAQHRLAGPAILGTEILYIYRFRVLGRMINVYATLHPLSSRP